MSHSMEDRDRLDADMIESAVLSPGYDLIRSRVLRAIDSKTRELVEHRLNEFDTAQLRGEILGLRLAVQIPKIVADECRAKEKK